MTPAEIVDLASLRRFFTLTLGRTPGEEEGVVHVAAVWRPPGEDRNVVLRIGEQTPESETDGLLLNVARARADAIVTTGRILREERSLTHEIRGTPGVRAALATWRREALGLEAPPWLVVLTRGRDFDLEHPALHGTARPVVFCPEASARAVERAVAGTPIVVVGRADTSVRAAIGWLRESLAARRISIEAGPSTAIEAYRPLLLVDELLLSVFAEPTIDRSLAGGELPPVAEIERLMGPARATFAVDEPSGRWRFERYLCAIVDAGAPPR